jgi:hypothetical protein
VRRHRSPTEHRSEWPGTATMAEPADRATAEALLQHDPYSHSNSHGHEVDLIAGEQRGAGSGAARWRSRSSGTRRCSRAMSSGTCES